MIKELSLLGVLGASEVLVLMEGSPLGRLEETKRALTGAAILLIRRPAAPPILKSDIVSYLVRGMVVTREDYPSDVVSCELQASHDTTE